MYNKLPRPEINQCPPVEACQSKSLVPLLPSVFAGQELEESGILESSSGVKLVKWRDLAVHLQI